MFIREGALFAVRFNPSTLRVTGTPVPVVEDVASNMTDGTAGYAVSKNGTLVYLRASEWLVPRRVLWTDRAGNEQPLLAESGQWAEPRLSPDGKWVALTRLDPRWQISLFDVQRRVLTQLTRSEGVSFNANWMPDSRSIIHSVETPVYDLLRLPIDGTAAETLLVTKRDKMASSVSPDGRTVAYQETENIDRLMLAPTPRGAAPVPVDPRPTSQRNAAFSPDGRWVLFEEVGANLRAEPSTATADDARSRTTVAISRSGRAADARSFTARVTRCSRRRSLRRPARSARRWSCSRNATPGGLVDSARGATT